MKLSWKVLFFPALIVLAVIGFAVLWLFMLFETIQLLWLRQRHVSFKHLREYFDIPDDVELCYGIQSPLLIRQIVTGAKRKDDLMLHGATAQKLKNGKYRITIYHQALQLCSVGYHSLILHELVHCNQFRSGRLDTAGMIWNDEGYPLAVKPETNLEVELCQSWEVEAYCAQWEWVARVPELIEEADIHTLNWMAVHMDVHRRLLANWSKDHEQAFQMVTTRINQFNGIED